MKIPAGTQPNQIFKVKGKGAKDVRGSNYGDEFVHLNVKTPTDLSKQQRKALQEFKDASDDKENLFAKFKANFKK